MMDFLKLTAAYLIGVGFGLAISITIMVLM